MARDLRVRCGSAGAAFAGRFYTYGELTRNMERARQGVNFLANEVPAVADALAAGARHCLAAAQNEKRVKGSAELALVPAKPACCGLFLVGGHSGPLQSKGKTLQQDSCLMKTPLPQLLLCVACVAFSGAVSAEKADRDKPMNVESDALRYDDLKQTSIFTGRVVLTKGTIIVRGAQINVRQDPEGYQYGVATAEPGKLAFYRQKREGLDEFIEGEGETIEYDGKADTVKFIKNAQLRRYRGAILNDEMTGGVILYNNSTDVFTIDGGAAKGGPAASGGRVRAMLTPKVDAVVPPALPAAAPGRAALPTPAPVLRATPTLSGEKK